LGVGLFGTSVTATERDMTGFWEFVKSGEIVEITKCGAKYCGRVAALWPRSAVLRDDQNPDRGRRQQKICGLHLFRLTGSQNGRELTGSSYSPEDGLLYILTVSLDGDLLHLSGMPQTP